MLGIMAREPCLRYVDQRIPQNCHTLSVPPSYTSNCHVCFAKGECVACTSKCKHTGDICRSCVRDYIKSRMPARTPNGHRAFELPTFPCITKGCGEVMHEKDVFNFAGRDALLEMIAQQRFFKNALARCKRDAETKTSAFMHRVHRCPKCRVPVEKACGCDHIRCTRCNAAFCWECNADWDLIYRTDRRAHKKHCSHYHARG